MHFLCARRRRRPGDPRRPQHTSKGEQQVLGKNFKFQPYFVLKFSSIQKSKLKLGF